MYVISHAGENIHADVVLLNMLVKAQNISFIIRMVYKQMAACISQHPAGNMINHARIFNAYMSSHVASKAEVYSMQVNA